MSLGGQGVENFPQVKTRDAVASQMGIGSGKQYEKEKYIVDNRATLTPEDFADWDEGRLSTNKAFKKQRKIAAEYVRLRGYKNGGNRKSDSHNENVLTLDEIAWQKNCILNEFLPIKI